MGKDSYKTRWGTFKFWDLVGLISEVLWYHYGDVTMGTIASQINSLTIVYSTVYSDTDDRKRQSSALLAFVRGIHRGPVNSPHKWPVTRKMFPFDDVIIMTRTISRDRETSRRSKRKAIRDENKRWTDRTIPYAFGEEGFGKWTIKLMYNIENKMWPFWRNRHHCYGSCQKDRFRCSQRCNLHQNDISASLAQHDRYTCFLYCHHCH